MNVHTLYSFTESQNYTFIMRTIINYERGEEKVHKIYCKLKRNCFEINH